MKHLHSMKLLHLDLLGKFSFQGNWPLVCGKTFNLLLDQMSLRRMRFFSFLNKRLKTPPIFLEAWKIVILNISIARFRMFVSWILNDLTLHRRSQKMYYFYKSIDSLEPSSTIYISINTYETFIRSYSGSELTTEW